MAESRIPVDLFNPGQVFACMGFLEAAETLLGGTEGGFDWADPGDVRFVLRAAGEVEPVREVLAFLAAATLRRFAPAGYRDQKKDEDAEEDAPKDPPEASQTFPSAEPDRMSLPIRLGGGNRPLVELTHWADGSGRDPLKLYSGNRSALGIATAMLAGLRTLHEQQPDALAAAPSDELMPMGGSFNFDPRGAWTALDAGYSLNEHKHAVLASPVVELLAPWGLEHARPQEVGRRRYAYAAWQPLLPPMLARPAIAGMLKALPQRRFHVSLPMSGKNKIMSHAEEDTSR